LQIDNALPLVPSDTGIMPNKRNMGEIAHLPIDSNTTVRTGNPKTAHWTTNSDNFLFAGYSPLIILSEGLFVCLLVALRPINI
jgi:hypothetical protein